MTKPKDLAKDYQKVLETLRFHARCYYEKDAPRITDAAYDALKESYEALLREDPTLVRYGTLGVGSPAARGFQKIRHMQPLYSLDNAKTTEDVEGFVERVHRYLQLPSSSKPLWVMEPKIDGLSVAILYEKDRLKHAATRGDGLVGEDVTANLQTLPQIPQNLSGKDIPPLVEVRGEVYMTKADFLTLNEAQAAQGEKIFANPRNAAAGSLRQLNPAITASRPLKFWMHGFAAPDGLPFDSYRVSLERFAAWGLPLNPLSRAGHTVEELLAFFTEINETRSALPYDIDGVVYKLDDLRLQARLGFVQRAPRWAIAHKFDPEKAQTTLERIEIQVGRHGTLTPVGILAPVGVGGVIVSRVSLHNADEISRKDIREGDHVEVQRAGDVIPQITRSFPEKRSGAPQHFTFPTVCPVCGAPTVQEPGEVAIRCTGGFTCHAQAIWRLRHFVSRPAFNIEGLGVKQLEAFYTNKIVLTPADLFTLEARNTTLEPPLEAWEGWGEKSAQNLFESIQARRTISLQRLIYALGIPQVGEGGASALADLYGSWEAFRGGMAALASGDERCVEALESVDGIGPHMVQALVLFFQKAENQSLVAALSEHVTVEPALRSSPAIENSFFKGKTFVLTGTLGRLSRAEAKDQIVARGGRVSSSLSAKTHYLIMGSNPGSKRAKAEALGVAILDDAAFEEALNRYRDINLET
jgi:DNA ligase (NAD+)